MKLSEISTEKLTDVLIELAEPVSNIACDDKTAERFRQFAGVSERSNIYAAGLMINKLLPLLLKDHAEDVYKIVSVLSEKTVDEVKAQKGIQTLNDVKESMDKDFMDFFMSFFGTGKTK